MMIATASKGQNKFSTLMIKSVFALLIIIMISLVPKQVKAGEQQGRCFLAAGAVRYDKTLSQCLNLFSHILLIRSAGDDCRVYFNVLYQGRGYALHWLPYACTNPNQDIYQNAINLNRGKPDYCPLGNPINQATGSKLQVASDYQGTGDFPLQFSRYYNSSTSPTGSISSIGSHWRSIYDRRVIEDSEYPIVQVDRPDGKRISFLISGSALVAQHHYSTLIQLKDANNVQTGWELTTEEDDIEQYDLSGRLFSIKHKGFTQTLSYDASNRLDQVTGPHGRTLTFGYDTNNRINLMTDPANEQYIYAYDASDNLKSITYPDTTIRQYHYENVSFPHALTGITDENNDRYASWSYDSVGRAYISEHAGGVEKVTLGYQSDGSVTVTDARQHTVTQTFSTLNSKIVMPYTLSSPSAACGESASYRTYFNNGKLESRTDFNGNVTGFTYNTRSLEETRTLGVGSTDAHTITTDWDPVFRLPTKITVLDRETELVYNTDGRLLTNKSTDTTTGKIRKTTLTYHANGLLETIDGSRTDVSDITSYDYDTQGNLKKITNALGHETLLSLYDAHGRPQNIEDPNGRLTELGYDLRGRLLTRKVDGQLTIIKYDNVGNLTQITTPDSVILKYHYDAAHRLDEIEDNLGNKITFTLDDLGNRTKEETKDTNGTLTRVLEREYDQFNQLLLLIGGEGQITRYQHDLTGNQTMVTDPRKTGGDRNVAKSLDPLQTENTSQSLYDPLNRLKSVTQLQVIGDTTDDITASYQYNALNQLTHVIDPKGLDTQYDYNALGDLLQLQSPDTGTSTNQYDDAGNRLTHQDARGITTTYSYDALNRLKTVTYPDSSLNISYQYDENQAGQNGIGRLTSMTDASGSTHYGYDLRGNLTTKTVAQGAVTQTLGYLYNGSNQLTGMTYPSGRTIIYHYDTAGRVDQVLTSNGQSAPQPLVDLIDYEPFGGMKSQVFGNSLTAAQSYDLDYRLDSQTIPTILERTYAFDDADNIQFITNLLDLNNDQDLTYDALSRLDSAQGNYGNATYQYDKTGNRIQYSNGSTTDDYHYPTDSHKLDDINTTNIYIYDANGNTTQLPSVSITTSLVYGDQNRLTQVNGATYTYNGLGERVKKVTTSSTTHYYYGQSGQLILETDALGQTQKEYLYLNGQLVAIAEATGINPPVESILDNPSASYTDNWSTSTSAAGYEGSDYQYHAGGTGSIAPGILGSPVDNLQASYTGAWSSSTLVNQYYASNYQYHSGFSAGPGLMGTPLDNLQAVYSGSWPTSTSYPQYYATNYQFHSAGTGSNTATWSTNVSGTASYDIYVAWTASSNRASDAKYTIQHSAGSDIVTVNQQQNGGQWNLLGTYTLDSDSSVSLSDDANGYVIADGVTILPAGTTPISIPQGEIASWPVNVSNTASYDVYVSWIAGSNRASDAKYTIHHNNGSDTVTVDQQQNGGQWNLLGTYTLDSSSTVELNTAANGYVIADGVTILPAGTTPTVSPEGEGETATWTATQTGQVEVYAKWTASPNRASDAKYTIHHSTGSSSVTVNQLQNGGQWNLLGTYTLDTGSTIELSAVANGYVIADAIRLVSTSSPLQSAVYYVHNDHLGTPQVITDAQQAVVWQAYYDPFGKATITTGTITNNIRFPGQYYDQETGLYYNYYRYYDPQTGRYITSDPIGLAGGLNTYGYVENNPINLIDPDGLRGLRRNSRGNFSYRQSFYNMRVNSLTRQIRQIDPTFRYQTNRRIGSRNNKNDIQNLEQTLQSTQNAGFCGIGASNAPQFNLNRAGLGHIFRDASGHVNPITQSSRNRFVNLFRKVGANPNNRNDSILPPQAVSTGSQGFTQTFNNGQVWVKVRDGQISNGGVNPNGSGR